MEKEIDQKFVVGVDGGGTKTEALLADAGGTILAAGKAGSSSLRNAGIKRSISSISLAIKEALRKGGRKEVHSVFVGMAAIEEEYRNEKRNMEEMISKEVKGNVFVDSDQIVAFRSGTDDKEGVVVIAGTGCVARGWKGSQDVKSSGWGWLADEGSACWTGQRGYQTAMKILDGRIKKSSLADLMMKSLKVRDPEGLNKAVYGGNAADILSSLSLIVDLSARRGDNNAKAILKEGGRELALAALTVIKKLKFRKKFPLVLTGGMFNSNILSTSFKREIKKESSNALFVVPDESPAVGAVKLAIEKLHEKKKS